MTSIPASIVLTWYNTNHPATYSPTASYGLFAVVIVSFVAMRRHDRRLCERCMSSMSLSPSQDAQRLHRRLALAHVASKPTVVIPYLALLIGSDFFTSTTPELVVWAIIQSSMIYLIASHLSHRRLQPWCPKCREGGSEVSDPVTPNPMPAGAPG